MRSGLLAVGLVLLVLGAILYFVPTPANASPTTVTQTTPATYQTSVNTTTYATLDNTTETNTSGTTGTSGTSSGGITTIYNTAAPANPTTTTTSSSTTGQTSITTTSFTDQPAQRQIAIIAMIIGAVLTILGLLLPDPHVHVSTARTTAPSARRVTYEEEEEIRRR